MKKLGAESSGEDMCNLVRYMIHFEKVVSSCFRFPSHPMFKANVSASGAKLWKVTNS